ncbi:MAG: hypothetical protein AB1634_00180 [Thermodesulfobacteriota bacterium]
MRRVDLLRPFWWAARNRLLPPGSVPLRSLGALFLTAGLCLILYLTAVRVVGYFHRQNELGIILSLKLFQMAWITLFAMLVFSCMVSAVSTLFLSQDNEIVYAAPVSPASIYFLRYTTTTVYTSWMTVIFSLPIFAAYGRVFATDWLFWPLLALAVTATAATATGFGMLVTVILVNLFPARRTKDIVVYLSLCFGVLIYVMFRLMRPEELVNPDSYAHFVDYLSGISRPAGPFVPAAWAANACATYLLDREVDWLLVGLLAATAPALFILGEWSMERLFFSGYSKAQESFGGHRRFPSLIGYRPRPWLWILVKEAKTFLRDSSEWAQLFMIGALVVVYLYNFKVLPVERSAFEEESITNLIAFLNIGLTGFVITSLAARFVFPAIGTEGGAFAIIRASPLPLTRFLLAKYLYYVLPLTALALVLVLASDHLLRIEGPMRLISVYTSTLITWTVTALALGFGSLFADFKAENRAAALGGLGAILFLLAASLFQVVIIATAAVPVYRLMRTWLKGGSPASFDLSLLVAWVVASLLIATLAVLVTVRRGLARLAAEGG